jgi:hypothetical protein
MISSNKDQHSEISIEDVRKVKGLENISDQQAKNIQENIIALCDAMAAIIIENNL